MNVRNQIRWWLYYAVVQLSEAVKRGVLSKKLFLKISQYSQENTCVGFSFLRRNSNTGAWCGQLFFDCFNGSQLHGPLRSRSRSYDGVSRHGPRDRSSFLFLSRNFSSWTEFPPTVENLRRIPSMNQCFYIGYLWSF